MTDPPAEGAAQACDRDAPQSLRWAGVRTHEAFDAVDRLLADGRPYLTGATLTFADITFASLGALAVLPPEYPGGALRGQRMTLDDVKDPAWRAEIERFRTRPSGQFILGLYRRERNARPTGTSAG